MHFMEELFDFRELITIFSHNFTFVQWIPHLQGSKFGLLLVFLVKYTFSIPHIHPMAFLIEFTTIEIQQFDENYCNIVFIF